MSARQSGFTLIELLASLVVAGLLLSLMSLTLWSIQSRNTTLQRASQTLQAKEQAAHFLQSVLVNAVSYHPDGTDTAFLQGTAETLIFFGPAPMALQSYGLMRYEVAPEGQDGKPQLLIKSALPWSPELNAASTAFAAFTDLRFDYLAPPQPDGTAPQWQDEWQDQSALPWAIKVTAALRGNPSDSIDMLVKLRRPIDPHCRFDSLSRRCVT